LNPCSLSKAEGQSKKRKKNKLEIKEVEDFQEFLERIVNSICNKHQAKPVHSLQEITKLKVVPKISGSLMFMRMVLL
jgi:hypothetical protein